MKFFNCIMMLNGGGFNGWEIFEKVCDMIVVGEFVIMLMIGEYDIGMLCEIFEVMYVVVLGGYIGYVVISGIFVLWDIVVKCVEVCICVFIMLKNVLIVSGG